MNLHPYETLTPDVVLDALDSIGLVCDGGLQTLSSYENRVYLGTLDSGAQVVAKFYRPGRWSEAQILEEHAFAAELQVAEVPIVAPLSFEGGATLHAHAGFLFSVSPRRGGRAPELDDEEVLEWTGRFLARLHNVGAARSFVHRPQLDVQSFGVKSRNWLLSNEVIPMDVQSAWHAACDEALALASRHPALSGQSPNGLIRLHGDCHIGNILWTPADAPADRQPGPHFVDLDDARMGPAVQDLWMLLSGERAERNFQLSCLLDGYEQLRAFDRRETALIEPLRTLRLIHYSDWLARRWDDPTFPLNFPWFGSRDYWQGQVQMLQEQIEAMQEEPLSG